MPNNFSLGKNLKAYRKAAGYNQEQFAALCGISRQSLHKHELDRANPTRSTLENYARVLGVRRTDIQEKIHPLIWNFQIFNTLTWGSCDDKLSGFALLLCCLLIASSVLLFGENPLLRIIASRKIFLTQAPWMSTSFFPKNRMVS